MVIKIQTMLFTRNRELSWSNSLIVNKTKDILARQKDEHSRFSRVVINCSREIIMNSKTGLMPISGQVITIPKILMAAKKNDLATTVQNLEGFSKKYFIRQESYLAHYHSICRMMDPKNILEKGFAIIYQENKIVASGDKIRMNEEIRVRMSDATILAKTISKNKIDGKGTDL
jgi:exodeoxyribonuclease VII large subunit